MPEYLSPGIYIEEIQTGPRPIEGVGTAMAAFVGFAPAGPANKPTLITNWTQYVATFSSVDQKGQRVTFTADSFLAHAVYGYFMNGGGRCYVTRVVPQAQQQPDPEPLRLPGKASQTATALIVSPKVQTAMDVQVEVSAPAEGAEKTEDEPEGTFTLKVRMGTVEELYEHVSFARRGAKNVIETVNQASKLISLAEGDAKGSPVERVPAPGNYVLSAPPVSSGVPQVRPNDLTGQVAERSGIEGLQVAEDVTMVCCPDLMMALQNGSLDRNGVKAVQLAMIAHCEAMGDRIAILDAPPNMKPQDVQRWREREAGYDSAFAALYYPWITIANPLAGEPGQDTQLLIPPCGHIAGIYARNDTQRGVHKAPANEIVQGALAPAMELTKGEQDVINPIGINCLRAFAGRGLRVWGARTLSSDPAWRYVNVRRLMSFVEESIEQGTQWIVFEPNDRDLWARVRRDIGNFLTTVWRAGMLFGSVPEEAFFVKCDDENNPSEVRDVGQLVVDVGVAPVKPAEFVIFRFRQMTMAMNSGGE